MTLVFLKVELEILMTENKIATEQITVEFFLFRGMIETTIEEAWHSVLEKQSGYEHRTDIKTSNAEV